jgi:PAS domain-containing protein
MRPDLRTDPDFFQLLNSSYARLLRESLVPENISDPARWLYEDAPFAVLAHNTAADPIFIYGNRAAQALFEYSWEELTVLPSRLSAEPVEQAERQQFLDRVLRDGFVTGYRGVRVARSGKRFWIEDATVWDLRDDAGTYRGQAAWIPRAVALP